MSRIPLRAWGYHGYYYYDPNQPSFKWVKLSRKEKLSDYKYLGIASRRFSVCWRYLIALYLQDDSLYLQVNRKRWNLLDPGIHLTVSTHFGISKFRVLIRGKCVFSHYYWNYASRPWKQLVEFPDYTPFEEQSDDIFLYMSEINGAGEFVTNLIEYYTDNYKKPDLLEVLQIKDKPT